MERLILLSMLSEEKSNKSVVDDTPTVPAPSDRVPCPAWHFLPPLGALFLPRWSFFNLLRSEGHFHRLNNTEEFGHQED